MKISLDWDGVIVDRITGEWIPGAEDALRDLLVRNHELFIHSCRCGYPEGRESILEKLADVHLRKHIHVHAKKPAADVYVDDKAVTFQGWPDTLQLLR
jgi:hypothetical protein